MKPVYLEFSGINSFSEKAVVDFKRLLSGGLFGIFGDTGSGKSTILDAIHLALYGKIERAAGSISDCINYNSDRAYVVYDFEIVENGERNAYRVQRERRRKNQGVKAYLYRLQEDGKPFALAEGSEEVDEKIHEIIGLDFVDFKKCIALPQGEFAALVESSNAERLKLMSRLFDLERYGEKLGANIRAGADRLYGECKTLEARMEENGGGEANVEELAKELQIKRDQLNAIEATLSEAKKVRERLSALAIEKKEYDELGLKLAKADGQFPAFERMRADLERAEKAERVKEAEETLLSTKKELFLAQKKAEEAEKRFAEKNARAEECQRTLTQSGFDLRIEKTTVDLSKVESAKKDVAFYEEMQKNLARCTSAYKAIKDKCPQEDFAKILQELDGKLTALGGDLSFAEYVKNGLKPVLLAETYEEVREDLQALEKKYPQTQADVAELLKKYALPQTDGFELATARRSFDELKTQSERIKNEKRKVEERQTAYEKNEAEKARIIEDGKHYRKICDEQAKKLSAVLELGEEEQLKASLERLKAEKRRLESFLKTAQEEATAERLETEKNRAVQASLTERANAEEKKLQALVEKGGFLSAKEAKEFLSSFGEYLVAKARTEAFFNEYRALKARFADCHAEKFQDFSLEKLQEVKTQESELDEARVALNGEIAVKKAQLERLKALRDKYLELKKQLDETRKKHALWEKLRSLTAKNKFMEFIASEYLQEVCLSASKTLLSLTGGRYFLRYDKEFKVGDNRKSGQLRAVKTLSGGETFLVSLSLALSLSGAIFSKSLRPIEFFFLDEGFGTLDDKLVDTVMDVLSKLSQNFAVGLISHVEELKRRIDNKILVIAANETRGSQISIETF